MSVPTISSDALSRVYAAAYAAPNGLTGGDGATVARQTAGANAVLEFVKLLDVQLGYKTITDE
jgi:hypothetical protein